MGRWDSSALIDQMSGRRFYGVIKHTVKEERTVSYTVDWYDVAWTESLPFADCTVTSRTSSFLNLATLRVISRQFNSSFRMLTVKRP